MASSIAECTVGMAKLLFAVMSTFGFLLLSERGVIALSGFMLSARPFILRALPMAEEYCWRSSLILQVYISP